MPARATHYTESLGAVIVSGATRATIATLTFTNIPSAQYVMGGSWNASRNLVDRSFSQLLYMETLATSTVGDFITGHQELTAPPDNRNHCVFRQVATPASAGTQTLRLQASVSSAQSWQEVTNSRLFAIKTTANDSYGEKTTDVVVQGGTLGVGTWTTVCSATFSAAANPYMIWGCASINVITPKNSGIRIAHQGTAGGRPAYHQINPAQDARAPFFVADMFTPAAAGSQSFELQAGCSGASVTAQNPRIIVWRPDDFNAFTAVVSDVTANTSSATYVTAMASSVPMADGPRYAILSHCYDRGQSITESHKAHFLIDTVTAAEQVLESVGTAAASPFDTKWQWYPMASLIVVSASAGTHELRFRSAAEVAGTGVDLAMQRIFVMQVEATGVAAPPATAGGTYYYRQRMSVA